MLKDGTAARGEAAASPGKWFHLRLGKQVVEVHFIAIAALGIFGAQFAAVPMAKSVFGKTASR